MAGDGARAPFTHSDTGTCCTRSFIPAPAVRDRPFPSEQVFSTAPVWLNEKLGSLYRQLGISSHGALAEGGERIRARL